MVIGSSNKTLGEFWLDIVCDRVEMRILKFSDDNQLDAEVILS